MTEIKESSDFQNDLNMDRLAEPFSEVEKLKSDKNIPEHSDNLNSDQIVINANSTDLLENSKLNRKETESMDSTSSEGDKSTSNEDEWLDIMGSGNFKKKVLKKGLGHETRPSRGEMVTVDVVQYVNGIVFEENKDCTFIVGDMDVIQGIDLVICLMEKEEKAKIIIPAKLAYGSKGRLPEVPPDTDIECDIELKDVKCVDTESLSMPETLKLGNEKRIRGNFFYERGEFIEAIHCYERAADYLDGIRNSSGSSKEESQEIIDMKLKVYNNMAASHLKLSAYSAALKSVELVLKVQPKNVKALFRKAKILGAQGCTDEAITCLRVAANLEPDTKVIQVELSKMQTKKKREQASQKAMYQRMFPQSPPRKSTLRTKLLKWSMFTGSILAVALGMFAYRQYHS